MIQLLHIPGIQYEGETSEQAEERNTTAPRNSFTDAVDALDAAITKASVLIG